MPSMPNTPLSGPFAWKGNDFADKDASLVVLSGRVAEEMERAAVAAHARGLRVPEVRRDDVPLPAFAADAERIRRIIENGCGFVRVQGVNMARIGREAARILFYAVGLHLGSVVSQNAFGDVIGDVRDLGLDPDNPDVRFYQTTRGHDFHNDQTDAIGLMCLAQAMRGGESSLVSAYSVHNAIMAERPDLLKVLYEPFVIDRRGERGRPEEGDTPYYALPVFNWHKGLLSTRLVPKSYYETAERFPEVPRMTAMQHAALDLLWEVAGRPGMAVTFTMQPGELQYVNNYSVWHTRSSYVDWPEAERKRHLIRTWHCLPNSRELPPAFRPRFGATEPGALRGFIPKSRERELQPA